MKWTRLHIDGYGKWHDFECDLDEQVVVIYGPNEAGKSTLLSFIRSVLYGFATRANPAERQEPVHGGKHGGRLFFENGAGESYVLERYAASSSKVKLIRRTDRDDDMGGTPVTEVLTQEEWERGYLAGMNERVYRQLFSITLSELAAIGLLEGDELGKQLYHASWNGGAAVAQTEKQLVSQLDALYRPRGSTHPMNKTVKAIEELESELRKLEDGIEAYTKLTSTITLLEEEQDAAEHAIPALHAEAALLARACEVHPHWLKLEVLRKEYRSLERWNALPEDLRSRWEAHEAEHSRLNAELIRCRSAKMKLEQLLASSNYDDIFLEEEDELGRLMLSAENIQALKLERQVTASDLGDLQDGLHQLERRIAPNWTNEETAAFQATIADREAVRQWRDEAQELAKARESFTAELRSLMPQLREVEQQLDNLQVKQMNGGHGEFELLPKTAESLLSAARAFEEAWREWELEHVREGQSNSEQRTPAQASQSMIQILWFACAVLTVAAAALGFTGMSLTAIGAGLAGILTGLSSFYLSKSKSAPKRSADRTAMRENSASAGSHLARRRLASALGTLVADPESILASLTDVQAIHGKSLSKPGHSAVPAAPLRSRASRTRDAGASAAADTVLQAMAETAAGRSRDGHTFVRERLLAAIDAKQSALQAERRQHEREEELRARSVRLREQANGAESHLRGTQERADGLAQHWQQRLEELGLPDSLSPEGTLEIFDLIEQARSRQQSAARMAIRLSGMESQIAQFEEAVLTTAAKSKLGLERTGKDSITVLHLLHAEAVKQRETKREAKLLQRQMEELDSLEQVSGLQFAAAEQQRLEWFQTAGTSNELEFQHAIEGAKRLREAEREIHQLEVEIGAGLSPGQTAKMLEWFGETGFPELTAKRDEAQRRLRLEEQRNRERSEQLGQYRLKLAQLVQDEEKSQLMSERERASALLDELLERYIVRSAALTLIRRTKRMMEEQRQPAVLRQASRLIQLLSGGRYIRIGLQPELQSIILETADHKQVDSIHLSRGTAEQVYLAMRFALADEAAASSGLPMVLDDLFVNFDKRRLTNAVDVLQELAGRRQLVLLTCHEHVRDLMLEKLPEAKLITLQS